MIQIIVIVKRNDNNSTVLMQSVGRQYLALRMNHDAMPKYSDMVHYYTVEYQKYKSL